MLSMQRLADGPVRYAIERSWCDSRGFFVEGRISAEPHGMTSLRVSAGARRYEVIRFDGPEQPAPADSPGGGGGRFAVYMPWRAGEAITFEAVTDIGTWSDAILLPDAVEPWAGPFCLTDGSTGVPQPPPDHDAGGLVHFLTDFRNQPVGAAGRRVAEVGSRAVSRSWASMRPWFDGFAAYVGVDIHPGENVDIIGDAHHLHELVGAGTLDAVFSLSVMEHLSHPWLFAHSVNRALRVGGVTYHATHQSWPIHAAPTDFWRFSDEALKMLFGAAMGFEVVRAGFMYPMRLYPEQLRPADVGMPLSPAWGGSFIYARKVADVAESAVAWPTDRESSQRIAVSYPVR